MGLKLIPPGQGSKLREYYIRFEGSTYGVLHVDNEAHTVSLIPLKELNNIPVCVEPLDPYKLHGVRVFDSSSFRMVLCFFDRFYVTVGDMHVSLYDAVLFPPVAEDQETTSALCGCAISPSGGRRQPRSRQHADQDSVQVVERGRRLGASRSATSLRRTTL